MSRKKMLFGIIAALLLALGDFLYWTLPFPLGKAVPEEDWNGAQLLYFDEQFDMREIVVEEDALQKIVTNIKAGQVTNRPRFRTVSQPYFQLYLYCGEGYPCSLTIVENGDISIAAGLDTDHRKYFDGGEELYRYLLNCTTFLPAVFPAE